MPRQTEGISTTQGARWECDECSRVERLPVVALGSMDDSARLRGYVITPSGKVWCPECTGKDEGYWDRRTLDMAAMAGIDAGNVAWGES